MKSAQHSFQHLGTPVYYTVCGCVKVCMCYVFVTVNEIASYILDSDVLSKQL